MNKGDVKVSYEDISVKLNKYKSGYVKGECRSSEYEARRKQEKALNTKLDLADTMFNELTFTFTSPQKEMVKELIRTFTNFNELYSQSTNEEMILAFIFYVRALYTKQLYIKQSLVKKFVRQDKQEQYPKACEIISWKITLHYIQKQPILPREPKHIDHNLLYKGKYVK